MCRQLSGEAIEIPTPSQSAIHKAIYARATQAVVLKNDAKEVKLTGLKLKDGKAQTIVEGLQDVLEEFNLRGSIVMIVADTTSMNTGKRTGVVVWLQEKFEEKCHPKPKFISCQNHVLDLFIWVVMDNELHGSTKSPNIEYFFVFDEQL
ncbi:unnamed protein product [Brassicogethes aeneus]|uniref:Uncharacterized protein n=1 Tax=Brassicogethes aeneus TaxID=1431903 RepID=A0A9P0B9E7_BRAAE|nr:unnamed protein product [Brassicogethes aeneus]